jgi:hypothetical protein
VGIRWEITTEEAQTLMDSARYAAQQAEGDLARRARRVCRHFDLVDPVTGEQVEGAPSMREFLGAI